MNNLWLIRGLPGAGKSTVADYLAHRFDFQNGNCSIFSHDYRGRRDFKDNRAWIEKQVKSDMIDGITDIIVHNVMSENWEFKELHRLASVYEYRLFSLVVEDRHNTGSVHSIPQSSLNRSEEKFKITLNQGNIR